MRSVRWTALALLAGCRSLLGFEDPSFSPDKDAAIADDDAAPATAQPGGGIGGGPIAGTLTVFALDKTTDLPVAGVGVTVGELTGTTDANGRVVFEDAGLVGPQTVLAMQTGYRAEQWVGVAGAVVTLPLLPSTIAPPAQATLTGTILGFDTINPPANHAKAAVVRFSFEEDSFDGRNEILTPSNANTCSNNTCSYTLASRTGSLALVAPVLDLDNKGTSNTADDTIAIVTYAFATGVVVADGVNQSNRTLAMIPAQTLVDVVSDFGAVPANLTTVFGGISIELGAEGIAPFLANSLTPTAPTNKVPPLSLFPGSTYRFLWTGQSATGESSSSIVRRGITVPISQAGTWLDMPRVQASRTTASWVSIPDALVYSVTIAAAGTNLLEVMVFDGSVSVVFPDPVVLPPGAVDITTSALGGTLDVTSFGFDADRAQVISTSSTHSTVN